jgi:hypothetical protein
MSRRTTHARAWTRRNWLLGTAALLGVARFHRAAPARAADGGEAVADRVVQRVRKAGLAPVGRSTTEHYLGIGDAPEDHRAEALKLCESLSAAYLEHFHDKQFPVAMPSERLCVVILKDLASYKAFLGEDPGAGVGGHYDIDPNWLVIFDFRTGGSLPKGANLERINTFALVHEAMHQLTYNTGLLDRKGDVPVAVSEGLAMYAELWRPGGRSVLGMTSKPRLRAIVDRAREGKDEIWIPVDRLLIEDALFDNAATRPLADGEAWVLVHYHLKTTAALPRFRAYLDAIRSRRDPTRRLADAREHLGELDRLNSALRRHATRLIRGE